MSSATTDSADFHVDAFPDAGIFAEIDNTGRSVTDLLTLLFSMPGCPPGREDLKGLPMPTAEEIAAMTARAEERLAQRIQTSPEARALIDASFSGSIEARRPALCVMLYTMEAEPVTVYRWMNAWLDSGNLRASEKLARHVGPFFVEYNKALGKLPRTTAAVSRAVCKLNRAAKLQRAFDNYKTVFAPKQPVNFWSIASFTVKDEVVSLEDFCGPPNEDAIIFRCTALVGASLALLSAVPDEDEIQPLTPATFVVVDSFQVQRKLHVILEQRSLPNSSHYETMISDYSSEIAGCVKQLCSLPTRAAFHYDLANALGTVGSVAVPGIGDMTKRQLYLKAIELDSSYASAFHKLGDLLSGSESVAVPGIGDMTKRELYLKAIELDPTALTPVTLESLAGSMMFWEKTVAVPGIGDMTKRQLYLKAIELDSTYASAFHKLGDSLSGPESVAVPGIGDMTKRELHLKATELDPTAFAPSKSLMCPTGSWEMVSVKRPDGTIQSVKQPAFALPWF